MMNYYKGITQIVSRIALVKNLIIFYKIQDKIPIIENLSKTFNKVIN